jgi:hypothetical protein
MYCNQISLREEKISIPEYFDFLSMKGGDIDMHRWDKTLDMGKYTHLEADRISCHKAIEDFRSGKEINFLNLRKFKRNTIPKCFVAYRDWFLLHDHPEDGATGKPHKDNPRDWSSCTDFTICSTRGTFSLAHRDALAVHTALWAETGSSKYWPFWGKLTSEQVQNWVKNRDPPGIPTAMWVPDGALMCQPAESGHAPMSAVDSAMSGLMFLHVDDVLAALICADQESSEDGEVLTNEDVAVEFRWKMSRFLRLWRSGNKFYSWGSQADLEKADELFEVSLIIGFSVFYAHLHDIELETEAPVL